MGLFGSSSTPTASSPEQQEIKSAVMKHLQQEAAMNNARQLIGKVNQHCFDHCVPAPGSTMTPSESTCLSQCMEKYISMWNVASKAYLARAATERKTGGLDTVAMNSLATGGPSPSSM
ncbi:Tim10/DDP family zinc finger-domain-containing protein [Aspergillus cavernicola]|uniref:Mitochondrial import inner membrane translocase subunit n=1 Tax=Aspergillus cavernicola TaxID=176166 RepID=A0ABR4IYX2_9EURO